nr:hypothetical protein [Tanacetum cinerariifolium]
MGVKAGGEYTLSFYARRGAGGINGLTASLVGEKGEDLGQGRTLSERYQWKETIGDVAARTPLINRWNMEFKHRSTPDYYQSFGLGFFEYFQLSEDIGAEPLPILNV